MPVTINRSTSAPVCTVFIISLHPFGESVVGRVEIVFWRRLWFNSIGFCFDASADPVPPAANSPQIFLVWIQPSSDPPSSNSPLLRWGERPHVDQVLLEVVHEPFAHEPIYPESIQIKVFEDVGNEVLAKERRSGQPHLGSPRCQPRFHPLMKLDQPRRGLPEIALGAIPHPRRVPDPGGDHFTQQLGHDREAIGNHQGEPPLDLLGPLQAHLKPAIDSLQALYLVLLDEDLIVDREPGKELLYAHAVGGALVELAADQGWVVQALVIQVDGFQDGFFSVLRQERLQYWQSPPSHPLSRHLQGWLLGFPMSNDAIHGSRLADGHFLFTSCAFFRRRIS